VDDLAAANERRERTLHLIENLEAYCSFMVELVFWWVPVNKDSQTYVESYMTYTR